MRPSVTWLACVLLGLGGCLESPARPQIACRYDGECTTGLCLGGVCVNPLDAHIDNDLAGDLAGTVDTGPAGDATAIDAVAPDVPLAPCTMDSECTPLLGSLGPCADAVCRQGLCKVEPLANKTTCMTTDGCPIEGTCQGGKCTPAPGAKAACDDKDPCTFDSCLGNACTNTKLADGSVCGGPACLPDVCVAGACVLGDKISPDSCYIGATCYAAGAFLADAPCQRCVPTQFQAKWSAIAAGPCNDGDACTTGDNCTIAAVCAGVATKCADSNPCTSDDCLVTTGSCVHLPAAGTCQDADPCTTGDACVSGACNGKGKLACDDGNGCTLDECVTGLGCKHTPQDGGPCLADTDPCTQDICKAGACVAVPLASKCVIGGTCVPANQTAADNPCLVCDPSKSKSGWTTLSGVPCSDDNECTFSDTCATGQCIGEFGSCNDKNDCTKDSCSPATGCVYAPTSGTCDDANACTLNDHCSAASCVGTPVLPASCGDGNPCTDDSCAPSFGCSHKPNAVPCSDGDPCTYKDFCNSGACIGGGVVCPCDSDAVCDDGNPCTQDACSIQQGCTNLPVAGTPCNDADACTTADTCNAGTCSGKALDCEDNNPCTAIGCVAETGCSALPVPDVACNDGNACTTADLCLKGNCMGTAKNCDDGNSCSIDSCDPKSGGCGHDSELNGVECAEDGIPCTVDQCLGGKCNHGTIGSNFCLINSTCLSGGAIQGAQACLGCLPLVSQTDWSPRTGLACNDGSACSFSDTCVGGGQCLGAPLPCDDNNPCTLNGCNPLATGPPCLYVPAIAPCSDGNPCTAADTCLGGKCLGSVATCDDGNGCTLDSCDVAKSGCVNSFLSVGTACADDGLTCTLDACVGGVCAHPLGVNVCLVAGTCHKPGASLPGKPCETCQPGVTPIDWSAASGGSCDDGTPCTIQDTCTLGGCLGTVAGACDDGNPCTDDGCLPPVGCVHTAAPGPCDDGNTCTTLDSCLGGVCVGGTAKACSGGLPGSCTTAICDPAVGCVAVTTCGALHQCQAGQCLTGPPGGPPGPVAVPVDPLLAPLPLLPTLRWQDSHLGPTGGIAQLWLAAQSRPCLPSLGETSAMVAAVLEPGVTQPTWLAMSQPAGQCAVQPLLLDHPATFDHLVLAWLQTSATTCPAGGLRLALLGLGGAGKSTTLAVPCPTGPGLPEPWLADPDLQAFPGAVANKVQDLGGLLLRGGMTETLAWHGAAALAWGGSGKPLVQASWLDWTPAIASARPVHVVQPSGKLLLTVQSFQKGADTLPALAGTKISDGGSVDTLTKVLVTGAEAPGTNLSYAGIQAAWDPEAARVGVLVSGLYEESGETRAFLAFTRLTADQPVMAKPAVVALFDPPADFPGAATIHAFRVAELQGTADFLLAWALPGSTAVQVMRLHPLDDKQFVVKSVTAVANNFAGHSSGPFVTGGGGLSELVISPDGKRFSLAWESTGGLHLLTALVP